MADERVESGGSSGLFAPGGPVATMVQEAARALREVEPSAFLVQPRVIRRVVKQEWDLPALTLQVPHRKSWIIPRNTLIRHVEWDELGLEANVELPDRAILIARPDDKHLESMSLSQLKLQVWRLLFHARIHDAFDQLVDQGKLRKSDFRQRIDQIGQVEFDEIHTVLKRENFIYAQTSLAEAYVEFAALYPELRHFAPHCLGSYFPSFADFNFVDELINRDVNLNELLEATRLEGTAEPVIGDQADDHDETDDELDILTGHVSQHDVDSQLISALAESEHEEGEGERFPSLVEDALSRIERASRPSLRSFGRMIRKADKAFARGNAVGAALWQIRAAKYATPELVSEAVGGALTDLQRLVRRMQIALDFDQSTAQAWYRSLVSLLLHAAHGFWNADKRLLYDLQKVCVDHEREIYTVDLVGWVASFGHRPIKRELPNQREVLMSKHLRSATRRLVASKLTGLERRRLSHLLHDAAESAERQMRTRLRPLTVDALEEVGLVPETLPDRVAFAKKVEELLDGVAHRGFLTMGDLRDAISRSNLKLSDLSGPAEFVVGDKLLKADYQLSRVLDGVYQRGDIYLRWLQRLSAASFGTVIGRFTTRFIAIPYGVAYLAFEAVVHIVEKLIPHAETPSTVVDTDPVSPAAEHVQPSPPDSGAVSTTADVEAVINAEADAGNQPSAPAEEVASSTDSIPGEHPAPNVTVSVDVTQVDETVDHSATTVATVAQPADAEQTASEAALHAVRGQMPEIVFVLGTLLLFIIHVAKFRQFLKTIFSSLFSVLRRIFYEWPARFLKQPLVRRFLKSPVFYYLRKFLIWPLIPTTLICWLLPRLYTNVPIQPWTNWIVVLAAMSIILNSRVGRDVEELSAEWLHSTWNRIRVHIFIALFELVMETFKWLLEWFERALYAVDEWLRFKSGETAVSLGLKAVLGVFWAAFTFVARFCVNLLIEPQINPIKHFPVVTVSHKLLLPLTPTLITQLAPIVGGEDLATAIVGPTIFVIPGVFGFMAWELKSNWRLYKANRGDNLKPVLVGSHGETFIRLMKPGFHSGTLPKLFSRLRRIDRRRAANEHVQARSKYLDQLHHVHVAVEHFVEREFLRLLQEAPAWTASDVQIERISLASNNIRIALSCRSLSDEPLMLVFEEQSGWLVAGARKSGWVRLLDDTQRDVLLTALIGFYKLCGVDMVREHIQASFAPRTIPYDVAEDGLIVWPDGRYEEEAVYNLWHHHTIRPYPRSVSRKFLLPTLTTESLLFVETPVSWSRWGPLWDQNGEESSEPLLPDHVRWKWSIKHNDEASGGRESADNTVTERERKD